MDWRIMQIRFMFRFRFHAKMAKKTAKTQSMTENELSKIAVDICFKIHSQYGPGLFESVYEEIFYYE